MGLVMAGGGAHPLNPIVVAIHGGAGTITRASMTAEKEAAYRAVLATSLAAGHAVLAAGGGAVDAVLAAVRVMEDSPLFNAGRGAVFTADGRNELDAAIMDGQTRAAGAVAGVTRIRNPILAAHAVMRRSPHVLLAGAGAERFAQAQGLELVGPEYFYTAERWEQLERARAADVVALDHDGAAALPRFGTVGAVALDREGNLAAGTSTGGMTNKRWGRVGDSPLVGAGTYADNDTAAVSATGTGEHFIRAVAAYDVAARMKYAGATLDEAAAAAVRDGVEPLGGRGGLVALDRRGNVALPFNSEGMYRGVVRDDGVPSIEIYRATGPRS
jgi:beta-aspartyl-peptidase (threonine type)